jgi:threonine dehydratase
VLNDIPNKKDIELAFKRINDLLNRTPVLSSTSLNRIFNTSLFFKCENFQKAGSFKSRGATNAIMCIEASRLKNGVATHSSGNFAQALSRAASANGVVSHIVMPENAPTVKVNAVKEYGGNVIFCEPTLEAREQTIKDVISKTGAVEVHPYDDYDIIAGQATATFELLDQVDDIDIILCPVGGGGLISGTALSSYYFGNDISVIGCEPKGADDAFRSFEAGKIIPSIKPNTIADGLLTSLGKKNFPIIQKYVNEIVTVSEESIVEAMRLVYERMKIIIEPSSAVTLASIIENKVDVSNKNVSLIISGGNVDLSKLPFNDE